LRLLKSPTVIARLVRATHFGDPRAELFLRYPVNCRWILDMYNVMQLIDDSMKFFWHRTTAHKQAHALYDLGIVDRLRCVRLNSAIRGTQHWMHEFDGSIIVVCERVSQFIETV
jgi:hypothetical protein